MSLYHKYRPKGLRGVIGNAKVVSSLKQMLKNKDTMPHAYLLSGPTGTGKTTIGRIIKTVLAVSDNDFKEINSSSERGIEAMRGIIKNSQYRPLDSDYRIYLIDECHKLTNDAQNALLKPLEDANAHVIFILCTTEPEKLIKALKGRCQSFQMEKLSDADMENLLNKIIKKEDETLAPKIVAQIIATADGHPRNAIQILEQVLNTDKDNRLEAAKVYEEEKALSIELCRALLGNATWKKISTILNGLKGQDAESIRRAVVWYAQAVLLKTDNEKAGLILEEFIEPFYHTGFPQLVLASYLVIKNS